jgi:hypothetical protein
MGVVTPRTSRLTRRRRCRRPSNRRARRPAERGAAQARNPEVGSSFAPAVARGPWWTNYDNLFWDKALKDLGLASVRSLGWNLGTLREIGGGLGADLPAAVRGGRGFTPRMAHTMALPMVTGLFGGIYHYLATGTAPEELKDYFFPKTGNVRPNGTDDRISLPTYMRDVYAVGRHPVDTAKHKLNPVLATLGEMLDNQDFYGAAIRNPDDPLVQQALDAAQHVGSAFVPFSVRGFMEGKQAASSTSGALQGVIGLTPAPSAMTRTSEEQADIERRGMRQSLRKKARNDDAPSAVERLREYVSGAR